MKAKTRNTLITILTLACASTAAISIVNKCLKVSATSGNVLPREDSGIFNWRLGSVYYTKRGSGKPLLLIHDLNSTASGEEWSRLGNFLADHFTLYTIDLLGCGRSEKPAVTYTAYLYAQLISDFTRSVIGRRTAAAASGESADILFCACANEPDLFDGIMAVNPKSVSAASRVPSRIGKLYKHVLDAPVIGTLIYNIAVNRTNIRESLRRDGFYNHALITPGLVDELSESAHLGSSPKSVFSSVCCSFTGTAVENPLKKIDNSIFLVGGEYASGMKEILSGYKDINPAIETFTVSGTRGLPQIEAPYELSNIMKTCLL